jgi:hypothetical protein
MAHRSDKKWWHVKAKKWYDKSNEAPKSNERCEVKHLKQRGTQMCNSVVGVGVLLLLLLFLLLAVVFFLLLLTVGVLLLLLLLLSF